MVDTPAHERGQGVLQHIRWRFLFSSRLYILCSPVNQFSIFLFIPALLTRAADQLLVYGRCICVCDVQWKVVKVHESHER